MKVYLVCHFDYDEHSVLGVYDSKDKAERHIASLPIEESEGSEEYDGSVYIYVGPQYIGIYELGEANAAIAAYDRSENFVIEEWEVA